MHSGASTMPRKMLAAVESPTAPPTPMRRSSTKAKPRTIGGRMPQWNISVVSTLITSTTGSAWIAKMKSAPGVLHSNGSGPPPR